MADCGGVGGHLGFQSVSSLGSTGVHSGGKHSWSSETFSQVSDGLQAPSDTTTIHHHLHHWSTPMTLVRSHPTLNDQPAKHGPPPRTRFQGGSSLCSTLTRDDVQPRWQRPAAVLSCKSSCLCPGPRFQPQVCPPSKASQGNRPAAAPTQIHIEAWDNKQHHYWPAHIYIFSAGSDRWQLYPGNNIALGICALFPASRGTQGEGDLRGNRAVRETW